MKKNLLTIFIVGLSFTGIGQFADFETPLNSADTAWFGQDQVTDGDTTFVSGEIEFETSYNSSWQSFTGWAYSNSTDITTPGYSNQFSAITGTGANSSDQFGICYTVSSRRAFSQNGLPITFSGTYITNTTYAYISMRDGDSFAKQFGDSTDANGTIDGTNGEDWFLLTIYGLGPDSTQTGDSINFYLADYRFSDSTQDYIINTWEFVDLSSLGAVYGLDFKLSSSDIGTWGMNTPSYFAMDELSGQYLSLPEDQTVGFKFYPNPANENVYVESPENAHLRLIDITGKVVFSINNTSGLVKIPLTDLNAGIYMLSVESNGVYNTQKLIKR